jgi:hypothetical protein
MSSRDGKSFGIMHPKLLTDKEAKVARSQRFDHRLCSAADESVIRESVHIGFLAL